MNALVDATPISVPARVRNVSAVWRTIELVGDVADRERVRVAQRLRVLQRRERVGGLARLRDDDDERVRVRHAVAVAVFARDLDLCTECRASDSIHCFATRPE